MKIFNWSERNKVDNLLKALDKRIEEKIESCNALLDTFDNMLSDKDKDRRKSIEEDRVSRKKRTFAKASELSQKLRMSTNSSYQIDSINVNYIEPEKLTVTLHHNYLTDHKLHPYFGNYIFKSQNSELITIPELEKIVSDIIEKYKNETV